MIFAQTENYVPSRSERFSSCRWSTLSLVCFILLCSRSGLAEPFIGQFELKTLESEPGSFEFQSQNAWASGQPTRQFEVDESGELLLDENSLFRARYALELEMGLTRALKMRIGIELEDERIDDPRTLSDANDYAGLKLEEIGAEIVAIVIPREGDGAGLGFVAELEGPIDQEGPNSLIVGPIVEYQSGEWFFATVPMVVRAFGGKSDDDDEPIDDKWDFAYAAQLMRRLSNEWSNALEAYGTIERLGDSGRPSESAQRFGDFDQHRLGPIVYYARSLASATSRAAGDDDDTPSLTIGFGVLEGLNSNTADHTIKLSIEVDF